MHMPVVCGMIAIPIGGSYSYAVHEYRYMFLELVFLSLSSVLMSVLVMVE